MAEDLRQAALDYHREPRPGKLEIRATKPLATQRDLALAYSPGVAAACEAIQAAPTSAADYTARGNLVAVISNGTAVLGLGDIGGLAAKPVMEGKAVLFKQFANIDVFDIEVAETDPQAFMDTVARLEPTFGGINLEDIKAPECFIIEQGLRERMGIPVFHDDQHGTAIVVAAAVTNALTVVGKDIAHVRLVTAGAGAAALACLDLLVALGLDPTHILVTDIAGVVYEGRTEQMDPYKARYARSTACRTLAAALEGADIFLGLSAGGILQAPWLETMAERPLILALANPVPEIMPDLARAVRPDALLATGRSDFPNQVNNVLCFPFLFRGALDVGATDINMAMKLACVEAIAELARAEPSDVVRRAYGGRTPRFGPEFLLPTPFDPRLMEYVPLAVARAAMESGVASRPVASLEAYRNGLQDKVFITGLTMRPVFELAQARVRRVVYSEGEDPRVLEAAQQVVDQGIARPVLVGRRGVMEERIADIGLSIRLDDDVEVAEPRMLADNAAYGEAYYEGVARRGYSPHEARDRLRDSPTTLAAMMVAAGDADALICGPVSRYLQHLEAIGEVIGRAEAAPCLAAMNALVMPSGIIFIADTRVIEDPDARQVAAITRLAAEGVRWFGLEPKVALLSHSNFGSHDSASARKMREALALVRAEQPELEVEGEMHGDLALSEAMRLARFPASRLKGRANLLVMPNQDAANIAFNLLKEVGEGIAIGPLLLGMARSAHIVTSSISVRGLLNMTALAAVRAA